MVNVKHTRNSLVRNAAVIVFREILLTPLACFFAALTDEISGDKCCALIVG